MPRNAEAVTLYFTQTCNLQCKYCYVPHHNDESKIRSKLLDKSIFQKIKEINGTDFRSFDLWGGETTRNLPVLTSLIDDAFIEEFMPKVEDFGFSTNLATKESVDAITNLKGKVLSLKRDWPIKKKFEEGRFMVQVSFDGPSFINDISRIGAKLERILEGVARLQKAGILVRPKGTLSPENVARLVHDEKAYEAYNNFVTYLAMQYDMHFAPTHIFPHSFTKEDGLNMASFCMKEHMNGRITNFDKTFESALLGMKVNGKHDSVVCSAGKPYNMYIDVDGNIHWCHHTFGAKDSKAVRPGYSDFTEGMRKDVVSLSDKLETARFDYVAKALSEAFPFEINYTLSMIDLLAKSKLLSPVYKDSCKMQQLLASVSILGGNCTAGDHEVTKEHLISDGSYLRLLGNGVLEDSIEFLRSIR